jgi:rod shape-determining protein MreC
MTARPRLLLVVLLLASFTLTTLDARAGDGSPFDPLRSAVDAVLGPVDRGVGRTSGAVGGAVAAVGDLADRSELSDLREENARLRRDLAAAEGADRTTAEWRALLRLQETGSWSLVPARVTGAGTALGFERTVTVDAGSRDGVAVGQAVVAGAGLLGRTVRVGPWTSVVLLVDDPGFGAGARLAETGALGLARGAGADGLTWTQVDAGPLDRGATLLTSGSDTFVPDVPLGRVTDVRSAPGGLTVTASVEPFVDTGRVDLVGVVVDADRAEPRETLAPPS